MKGLAGVVAFVVCTLACQLVAAQSEDAEPATSAANDTFAKSLPLGRAKNVDARVKPGHDENKKSC